MAGDWLKIEKDTPDKPEVFRLAEVLGISQGDAFLACFRIWRWADSVTPDGAVRGVSPATLDALCHVPGFANALRDVGWLQARDGSLAIPNFVRHMGQAAKKRSLDNVRKMSARKADKTRTREEKRREEKETPLPPSLDSPAFLEAWGRWKNHRKEIKKSLTETQTAAQLAQFAAWGIPRSVAAINHTIRNGWQGIREPDPPPGQKHGTPPSPPTDFDALAAKSREHARKLKEGA